VPPGLVGGAIVIFIKVGLWIYLCGMSRSWIVIGRLLI